MSRRKRSPKLLGWSTQCFLTLAAQRADLALVVLVDPARFAVLAIETVLPSGAAGPAAIEKVFDQHAHKVVGEANDLAGAIALAEFFATTWLAAEGASAPCMCGEIDPLPQAVSA